MTRPDLTQRQADICSLLVAGESRSAIAKTLGISARVVRFHMENAAVRIREKHPDIPRASPRKVILRYFAAAAGLAPFDAEKEDSDPK